ncbi:MAG: hypothetical protein JSS51_06355 [Planctomycetes bacterium]|nr:hypothetical protein [Planctomycetota bacterium]
MRRLVISGLVWLGWGPVCLGAPVNADWPSAFPAGAAIGAVASSSLGGYHAVADATSDSIEIRDTRGNLLQTLSRTRLISVAPWMALNASSDGPVSLAFSDSGRLLFIGLHTTSASPDANPADAVLRYDTQADQLSLFTRVDLSPPDAVFTHLGMAHYKGRLYVGRNGEIRCYSAGRAATTGSLLFTTALTAGQYPAGLAVDRATNALLGCWGGQVWRSTIGSNSLTFSSLGSVGNLRDLAFSDHYGGAGNAGLYMVASTGAGSAIWFVPVAQARGTQAFSPSIYTGPGAAQTSLASTADGALLSARGSVVQRSTDSSDTRLSFEGWLQDEIAQVTAFGKGLVSPDGEPPGWVIDADVIPSWNRFHPASPDAAAWTVLLCLMSDELSGSSANLPTVRTVLNRYAGLAPDGIKPDRSTDGIYQHWIDPATGLVEWTDGYATMSTMKIVHAAAKAALFYPGDPQIRAAAKAIIGGVKNWDAYLIPSGGVFFLLGKQTGGPLTSAQSYCYNEGLIFVNEAAFYGGANADTAYGNWLNRPLWAKTAFIAGFDITTDFVGTFQSAFTNLYSLLLIDGYRQSSDWRTQIRNLRLSNYAWTDDNGPRWNTVFSAGTTPGGYNADSLGSHQYDIATFTSLEAFAAGDGSGTAHVPAATGAYHAYRTGARQTFKTGASILYRRSNTQPTWDPDSAGMPDVALGALGLAELVKPGAVQTVLAGPMLNLASCAADLNNDGMVDDADFVLFAARYNELLTPGAYRPGDLNGDSVCDDADFVLFVAAYNDLLCI